VRPQGRAAPGKPDGCLLCCKLLKSIVVVPPAVTVADEEAVLLDADVAVIVY
jgi:hypothetical protein